MVVLQNNHCCFTEDWKIKVYIYSTTPSNLIFEQDGLPCDSKTFLNIGIGRLADNTQLS